MPVVLRARPVPGANHQKGNSNTDAELDSAHPDVFRTCRQYLFHLRKPCCPFSVDELTAEPPWWKKPDMVLSRILEKDVRTSRVGHSSRKGLSQGQIRTMRDNKKRHWCWHLSVCAIARFSDFRTPTYIGRNSFPRHIFANGTNKILL